MRNICLVAACWLATVIIGNEVGYRLYYRGQGYGLSLYLRRYPSQIWLHCNPPDLCISAGYDWKESSKWHRDCVGAQLTNNWVSCFRRTW